MEQIIIRIVALAGALLCMNGAVAQSTQKSAEQKPEKIVLRFRAGDTAPTVVAAKPPASQDADANPPEAQLRFDQAKREEVADMPETENPPQITAQHGFVYKLNRKRVAGEQAYNAVTLWNVRRVRINQRRMRLSDTTGRERVWMLKFFTVRNPKKGTRPHLLGNVGGYNWSTGYWDMKTQTPHDQPLHIGTYTLRREYDSMRRARPDLSFFRVPEELLRNLPVDAVYMLDGKPTPPVVFRIFDGLTLRTLDIHTDSETMARYGTDAGVVIGDTYPDRVPLVVLNGEVSTVDVWLKMCESNAFAMDAEIPMHYFFMQPVEAVQNYGKSGRFGAICVNIAK